MLKRTPPLSEWSPFEDDFPDIDKLNEEQTAQVLTRLEEYLIVGVDPGRRDIVTANYKSLSSSSTWSVTSCRGRTPSSTSARLQSNSGLVATFTFRSHRASGRAAPLGAGLHLRRLTELFPCLLLPWVRLSWLDWRRAYIRFFGKKGNRQVEPTDNFLNC